MGQLANVAGAIELTRSYTRFQRRRADMARLTSHFPEPNALSQLNFRVEVLELAACVLDFHLPVDAALGRVDVGRPGRQFGLELGQRTAPAT